MRFALLSIMMTLLAFGSVAANAQNVEVATPAISEEIVAVVNDEVISSSDLRSRVKMAMMALNLPETEEVRARLRPQVIDDLINERLQLQEASRLGVDVSDEQLDQAFDSVARNNDLTVSEFRQELAKSDVPEDTLRAQLRSQLSWTRVLQRNVRNRIDITDEDVDAVLERLQKSEGQNEYLVGEIYLEIDQPSEEEAVRNRAQALISRIKSGANFSAIAQQFSETVGANRGGDLGWVPEDQLSPATRDVLSEMPVGALSNPIRDLNGYRIILLRNKRTASRDDTLVTLKQLFIRNPDNGDLQALKATVDHVLGRNIQGCDRLERFARQNGAYKLDEGEVRMSGMPEMVRQAVSQAEIGEFSPPIRNDQGVILLMPCQKTEIHAELPSREEITQKLGMERMEVLQRRYMRDLRAAAFIEVRYGG